MRTLKKLLYVACTASLLTSCEETYNDKLFWPGELNQEYGSYIKPATLDLTYSGEKLVGKTVDFKTDDSEKGTTLFREKKQLLSKSIYANREIPIHSVERISQ